MLAFVTLTLVLKYFMPFLVGALIAYAAQKPSNYFSSKLQIKKDKLSAVIAVLIYLCSVSLLLFLIYGFIKYAINLTDVFPKFFNGLNSVFEDVGKKYSKIFSLIPEKISFAFNSAIENGIDKITENAFEKISVSAGEFVKEIPAFFIVNIVTLVATFYISKDFERLLKFFKTLFGKKIVAKTVKIKNILFGSVFKLVKGYLILAFLSFCELYMGFLILRVKFPLMVAVIIALVDLMPVLGTGTVLLPWSVAAMISGELRFGIGLLILYIVTFSVRNFAEPKIIGKQVGINSLFTLMCMFAGLKIAGTAGLILFPLVFIVTVRYYKDEINEEVSA